MDYYQGVVSEYLRANRATFINTEYCIQLVRGKEDKGSHWYCDAIALSFSEKTVYLCEVTFAVNPTALQQRLLAWSKHWDGLCEAVRRDGHFDDALANWKDWKVRPWIFVPETGRQRFKDWEQTANLNFSSKITALEETQPWRYRSWDREIKNDADLKD